ncbi:hypothetical protein QAD02_010763 [Eretmocerus hayati]|uniref:Uncharacterized protein n=1 Tax=Eretmocerus hayati TaxID=131215 RepID=A0ACC2NV20_9HYME|nr:hypothetical protein QAD02_010763 [Eretmocerus hayati]
MQKSNEIFNTLNQEYQLAYEKIRAADRRSRETIAEMIQMGRHMEKHRDRAENLIQMLDQMFLEVDQHMDCIEKWGLTILKVIRETYEDRTNALKKLEELFHHLEVNQDFQIDEMMGEGSLKNLEETRKKLHDFSSSEREVLKILTSLQKIKTEQAEMLETMLSELKMSVKTDFTDSCVIGRTI